MTRFEPFQGLRYDTSVAPLQSVICPPYDVVDAAERIAFAARSPFNAIHVELPIADGAVDRYAHAAALFSDWQHAGALVRDDAPGFYVYRMTFLDEHGTTRTTTGAVGALGIDAIGEGSVLPHEQTMPKPKGDRLDLLRATHVNVSPIWGLSLAPGLGTQLAEMTAASAPAAGARDDDGTLHELWVVSADADVAAISALVATTPVVVADGHHRYETASHFRAEVRAANGDAPGAHDLVMALVVELSPEELFVQGIHRIIDGLPDDFDLLAALGRWFEIDAGPREPAECAAQLGARGALGLVTAHGTHYLRPRAELDAAIDADLDSSRLATALATLPPHELVYQHGTELAARLVREGSAQYAILVRPATVAQIADTAHRGTRMPPKTTFFNPKPRTGVVFRALDA